jgi:hypothetical protein
MRSRRRTGRQRVSSIRTTANTLLVIQNTNTPCAQARRVSDHTDRGGSRTHGGQRERDRNAGHRQQTDDAVQARLHVVQLTGTQLPPPVLRQLVGSIYRKTMLK